MEPIVLEDWLRVASSSVLSASSALAPASGQSAPPEFAANAIAHAWAQIRVCVQQQKALTSSDSGAFDVLNRHRRSLHLADSQAKLLQALLTEVSSNDSALLGSVRRFAVLGLLAWIRKSFTGTGSTASATSAKRPAPETIASVVQSIRKAMEERPLSDLYTCEVILLLGTISTLQFVSAAVRSYCLTAITVELEERRDVIVRGAIAVALAGAGHALAVSSQEHFIPILRALLLLWTPPPELPPGTEVAEEKGRLEFELESRQSSRGQDGTILKDVVMLLHLMDYLCSIFLSRGTSQTTSSTPPVEVMHEALLKVLENNRGTPFPLQCTSIMASVGLLRSLYRWDRGNKKRGIAVPVDHKCLAILGNLEGLLIKICEHVVTSNANLSSKFPSGRLFVAAGISLQAGNQQLCRCVGVAVSRCRGLPAHPHILRCLLLCIFGDALYLDTLYSVLRAQLVTGAVGLDQQQEYASQEEKIVPTENTSDLVSSLDDFQVHVDSFFFQEMGAIARAMCDQYRWTRGDLRGQTEHMVSQYARNLYEKHRLLVAISQMPRGLGWQHYRQTLEKVLEAAFITVVVFFSLMVREHVPENSDGLEAERAALALDSLSCVEYFRHVQLREFSKVIQRSVSQIAGSEAASVLFARLLPAYQDIIQGPGTPDLNLTYSWGQDEVQTARILFFFRVMPLCLIKMPEETFAAEVAPSMFLYMQHSSETVTKAAHALFASFLSLSLRSELTVKLGTKSSQKSTDPAPETKLTMTLRERLVVFYIQRALQEFPGVTPFQGLVAGVGAIARQLPAGSPATVYCLNCLVDKAAILYDAKFNSKNGTPQIKQPQKDTSVSNGPQRRNSPGDEIGAARKIQILLLHLILLVDLQVLPVLLKLMAKLILGLPRQFQATALAEAFDIVGNSDDYTRKPIVVPWLQSLSFLSFNTQGLPENTQPHNDEDSSSDKTHNDENSSSDKTHNDENSSSDKTHNDEDSSSDKTHNDEGSSSDKTRSVNGSNPETVSRGNSIEVTSSDHAPQEITEVEKQVSNTDSLVESKTVAPISKLRHCSEVTEERLEVDNEGTKEQAGVHVKTLEPRAKL